MRSFMGSMFAAKKEEEPTPEENPVPENKIIVNTTNPEKPEEVAVKNISGASGFNLPGIG